VNEMVTTPAAKARLWRTRSAVAADMESAHILAWARRAGYPALAVRAVADDPDEELPSELLRAVGADGRMQPLAIARFLGHPHLVRAAWRLGHHSRRALASLARFVRAFVDLPGAL